MCIPHIYPRPTTFFFFNLLKYAMHLKKYKIIIKYIYIYVKTVREALRSRQ
jgi:hypothetical protein